METPATETALDRSPQPERRLVEFRDADINGFNFRGVAAVFDSPWNDTLTEKLGYVETIARGAFRKALSAGDNVPLLGAHRRHELLASTKAGTLKVAEEPTALLVEATLPQNYLGEYYREMIHRGDIQGMSYGMETAPEDSVVSKRDGRYYRSIANVRRLLDVTLTWEPAYPATAAELRDMLSCKPLQELGVGLEDQGVETVVADPPSSEQRRRAMSLLIDQLEGGFYQ